MLATFFDQEVVKCVKLDCRALYFTYERISVMNVCLCLLCVLANASLWAFIKDIVPVYIFEHLSTSSAISGVNCYYFRFLYNLAVAGQ